MRTVQGEEGEVPAVPRYTGWRWLHHSRWWRTSGGKKTPASKSVYVIMIGGGQAIFQSPELEHPLELSAPPSIMCVPIMDGLIQVLV